jgi:hypothetical protein
VKIRTQQHYRDQWTAIDESTYDGAPDAGAARTMGLGNTEETAIEDLLRQMEDGEPWQQEAVRKYRGVAA